MKESKLFKSLVATFVVIVLSGPAVVLAGTSSHLETNKATVSYADLNLENEESVRILYRRLKRASKEACGGDEPLGALDAFTRENMQELILGVWKQTRKTVFFITHSVEEALFMATRLIVMSPRPGRITHEYDLQFCEQFLDNGNARQIKSDPEFIEIREEILSIIHGETIDELERLA